MNKAKRPFIILSALVLISLLCAGWLWPRYTVPILTYHSIAIDHESSFYVNPRNFARQMEYLKKKGYNVISLDELVENIRAKKPFKRNEVVITFDDGYQDNYTQAYPVLKKMGFPATIFLISDFMGKSVKHLPKTLSWDEVRVMSGNGISFGAHTKTHRYLGNVLDEDIAWEEIVGSKKAIEENIRRSVDYFCFPVGGFNERTKEMVVLAGYKGACTTNRGFSRSNRDVYELKRIKVTNSDTNIPFSFWAKLSGYYNIFRKEKYPY